MYCPKCGQEVGDYTRICPGCGELIESDSQASPGAQQPPQTDYRNNQYNPTPAPVMPQVPDYKVQSILLIVFSSILCCVDCISILALPFAIVALVHSNKISTHLTLGNPALAQETSKKTKMWCWISFGILLGTILLYIIYLVYLFRSGTYQDLMERIMDMQYPYDFSY